MNRTLSKNDADLKLMQKEISAKEHRITELDKIIKKLYEDNFSGKLSDERYMIFSRDYENEQHTLRTEVDSLKLQIQEQDSKVVNINSFVEIAKKYTSFEKLTPGMLHELVEKSWYTRVIKAADIVFKNRHLLFFRWRPGVLSCGRPTNSENEVA